MSTDNGYRTTVRGDDLDFRDIDDAPVEDVDEDEVEEIEVQLVVLDLAGTTVADEGIVESAFERALVDTGITESDDEKLRALEYVHETMGQSKIDVFRVLADDEEQAQHANAVFEGAYAELLVSQGVKAIPGAEQVIRELRTAGVKVALVTGFSAQTRDTLLASLGWQDLADVVLSPADAGRGRPYPDLPLTALLRTGATTVDSVIVVGDTAADIESGIAAGAGVTVGVLTGAHDERTLIDAGADAVIDSVADLPGLLGLDD
jgi:phosphonatase-like hydrolase